METILTVKNLRKVYKNQRGIKDVSFSIEKGDVFGLLGANGAGKTTTMKIITGLIQNYSGDVELIGANPIENFETVMKNVGSLIEMPSFYTYMSAEKNLRLAYQYYKGMTKQEIETDIAEKLELVKLSGVSKDRVSKFSLGMKQRLGIALAMVGDPLLYVFDEPANGLDIEGIIEIRNIILELAENKNASFIISSHQSAELQKTCNRVGIIHNGELKDSAYMSYILENFPSLEDYYLFVIGGGRSNDGNYGEKSSTEGEETA